MKKVYLLGTLALVVAGLSTGCSVNVSKDGNSLEINKPTKKTVKKSTSNTKKVPSQSSKQETQRWDERKSATLDQKMQAYAKQRKISLTKYDNKHSLKVAGGRLYPDTFKKDTFYLKGQKISIGWSPQGEHKYDYDVMSIYNHDLGNQGHHETYLFCMHDNKPIVLVDTTRDSSRINLVESTDKTLNNNFDQVMAQD
ncbi:DUF4767 domain-containing protein [Lactobacillus sp. PV034]|uniref:DUF4767 domain-containing protein n=1 Tax=Lactobacillus sp. PV034 TaxID=2594495 RepID=UPI00223F116C|nr:DUF4767 domain-containing protein [Lactobacillus sp. PV034]QNQ80563.1 DUF4767 domain-containing protein [Lactobacillus sp. PV034]